MSNATSALSVLPYGKGHRSILLPIDGGAAIKAGTLVSQLASTAMLVPGSTASSGAAVGVAAHDQDNTDGSDGDLRVEVLYDGVFLFANGTSTDACSEATPLFSVVYMADDHTVYDNDASGTLKPAGRFVGMEPDGKVRVFVGMSNLGDSLADAEDVGIADTGAFTTATDVEGALAELYQHLFAASGGCVPIPLGAFRECSSAGAVGDTTANGGVLASDTTPILGAEATTEMQAIIWAAANSDIIQVSISLPKDLDDTANVTIDLLVRTDNAGGGGTEAATFTVLTTWDNGTQVSDTATDSSPSETYHVVTATIAAADVPASPTAVSIQLVMGTHANDPTRLAGVRLNYKRKLLTA